MGLLCHAVCPEARDGVGWSGQGEKSSHPSGRIVSCGFAENWRDCSEDWRHVWTQGCGLSFDQPVALIWWAFVQFMGDSPPADTSSLGDSPVQAGPSWRCWYMHWFEGCLLQPPEGQFPKAVIFTFLLTKSPTLHHEFSRWSQQGSLIASSHVSLPQESISCLAEARQDHSVYGRVGLLQDSTLPLHHLTTEAWLCRLCKLQSRNLLPKTILVFCKENGSAFFIESAQRTSVCQLL